MKQDGKSERINDVVAAGVAAEDIEWLFEEPMVPRRGITILAGRRAATKTTLACWLAAKATADGVNVFFASQEDDTASFLQPRMLAAGADVSRIFYPMATESPLRFPADVNRLDAYVRERDIGLVILDPLSAFVPAFTSPAPARDALTPLWALSRRSECAVVFVHHFRKAGGKDVAEAIGGTGALLDVARAVYVYGAAPEDDHMVAALTGVYLDPDKRVLACAKLNGSELPLSMEFTVETVDVNLRDEVPRVTHTGDSDVTADEVFRTWMVASKSSGADQTALEEAKQFIYDMLKDGPRPSAQVREDADAAGISWTTVKRAKAGVVRTYKQEDRWFMRLDVPDVIPGDWS